jgi:hypothetical protein
MRKLAEPNIEQQIEGVVADLTREFEEKVPPDRVREQVMSHYGRLAHSKIMTYVPLLTRRASRDSLRQMMV